MDKDHLSPLTKALQVAGLELHPSTVRRHLEAGTIRACKIGARWMVRPSDLIAGLVRRVGPAEDGGQQ